MVSTYVSTYTYPTYIYHSLLYLVHVHHETTQCFIKQSRDFCVLVNEREEVSGTILSAGSCDVM